MVIRPLKCPVNVVTDFLGLFVCLTTGISKVGTFCNLVNIFPPILTHECFHFVNRQIVQCMYSGEEWEFFFFFLGFHYLFITNIPCPESSPVRSSLR